MNLSALNKYHTVGCAAFLLLWTASFHTVAQQGPPGFTTTQYGQRFPGTSIKTTFDQANRLYVGEKAGRVWVTINGIRRTDPLLDISEEVDNFSDRGLLSVAPDPDFLQNGYLYLSYVVDRHYLLNYGTAAYDPDASDVGATILRVTRYTVTPASLTATDPNDMAILPNSRLILLGEAIGTSEALLDGSHSGGDLAFGADGTLLVSTGDGAGLNGRDVGGSGNPGYGSSFWEQALNDGLIDFWGNIGAYRSQYLDSFNGKILRLDRATGDGVASNPYYDPIHPRSARSRMFARGLRNPYRISIRPGTGSTNPADANPGSLYIGDVGWNRYEEIHIMKRPDQNFGWPYFEGISFVEGRSEFYVIPPNKMNSPTDSTSNIYYDRLPNPDDSLALFSRPEIAIGHQDQGTSYVQHGAHYYLPTLNLPYNNVSLGGNAIIDGGWTSYSNNLPAAYQNRYFFGDYVREWLAYAEFDSEDQPIAINHFAQGFNGLVDLTINPVDNLPYLLYFFNIDVFQLNYTDNQPPVVSLEADKTYGSSPLAVSFDASASMDPEGTPLTYEWDFGDGSPTYSGLSSMVHSYTAATVRSYTATLTITDLGGSSVQKSILISINNTPPFIQTTSLDALTAITPTASTPLTLSAVVTDAEHTAGQLTYHWQLYHMHNDHSHPEEAFSTPTASVTLAPLGTCSGLETYWYRLTLTVTDPAGLSTTAYRDVYPDCEGTEQTITFLTPTRQLVTAAPFRPVVWSSSGLPVTLFRISGPAFMEGANLRLTGNPGLVTLRAMQSGNTTFRPARTVEKSFRVVNSLAPVADLALSMVFGSHLVATDSTVSLSLVVTNGGPDEATNVAVTSRLPADLAFISSASLVHQSGLVSGTIATIPAGTSELLALQVKPTSAGLYLVSAEISAAQAFDPDSQPGSGTGDGEDDMAQADLRTLTAGAVRLSPNPNQQPLPPVASNQPGPVANKVDLSLAIQASKLTAIVNEPITVTLISTNMGSLPANSVVIRDTLSDGLVLSASSAFSVVLTGAGYTVIEATIASLPPGQSAALTVSLLPTNAGTIRTAAQIWSVGNPGPNVPADADSTPGNGVTNGEDDCVLIDWRVR
ncbi:PKD domain-containing protein [Fibrella arboris]|uniref:PKD domain-containing protein n=1 Tax=Fibrella arboris TaxID=3242486 RepID=UPI00352126AB